MDDIIRKYPQKPEAVYYFGTCLAETFYPGAGMAGIKLLQREGVRVIFPSGQTCCGQPAYNAGFSWEARNVARQQIKLFPKPLPIVVPSGSCAGMMRHQYPVLFADDPDIDRVQKFSERVFELSEFLVHVLDIKLVDLGSPMKVTWHSSCHAMREMNVIEDSKSLIRQLKNVEFVELENEHECCGFGGTFSIKHPRISEAMVRDKVAAVRKTGAPMVLAGDCGCMMNISGAMAYQKIPVESRHLAEFLWERTNG
jgi:L-lactate dehydrogenase complex protein LldE